MDSGAPPQSVPDHQGWLLALVLGFCAFAQVGGGRMMVAHAQGDGGSCKTLHTMLCPHFHP